ncbi:MAG TPA: ABC transporter permease [Devosiaceae bacterium]|jgi:putative ABC transport system permease protein
MNPTSIAWAMIRRHPATTIIFVVVIAVAVALGIGISAQERSLREGSAMAADRFDLLIAAPGNPTEIVFNTIFLRPSAVQLLDPDIVAKALTDTRVDYAAPIGYGDNVQGLQVIGTISQFVDRLSGGLSEGRMFADPTEAVIGASVPFQIGQKVTPLHGSSAFEDADEAEESEAEEGHHHYDLTIVGRMKPTGNPWDRAVIVPIETLWNAHGLPNGHAEGDTKIGPPFDPARVPGLPAIVMKGKTVADMYGLRDEYKTPQSMAFFPAEVLLQIYDLVGNIRQVMSIMASVTQVLAFLSIFAGVVALMKLFETQFAVIRALGASRTYLFLSIWLFASIIVLSGVVLGVALGYGVAAFASRILARMSGVSLTASIGPDEVWLAISGGLIGIVLATVPALLLYRRSVAAFLR